jgi:hypothetical protein
MIDSFPVENGQDQRILMPLTTWFDDGILPSDWNSLQFLRNVGLTTAQFQPFICNEQLRYILATYKKEPKKT